MSFTDSRTLAVDTERNSNPSAGPSCLPFGREQRFKSRTRRRGRCKRNAGFPSTSCSGSRFNLRLVFHSADHANPDRDSHSQFDVTVLGSGRRSLRMLTMDRGTEVSGPRMMTSVMSVVSSRVRGALGLDRESKRRFDILWRKILGL